MFAVIETGGKQYLVTSGALLKVEKLPAEVGSEIVFDKVLLTAEDDGTKVQVGKPYLEGVSITATVEEQGRGTKIRVVKYKRKVRYKRARGHRQHFTKVKLGAVK
ncbi:MAG: 50S ribosomal protein L21 [Candidatus Magasanikbacteria bacterium GW2011_GWA2_56_11]|uniref:Large ribosomal subunit protein bL21 n=1 Tax=Candidatus Magasanikbacteria bacterium GW2011_GWA2_56_11 TaxID=1619044 RepID=A0A0G1YE63_9BACT|nr:MAG: 50S ribosomal protein L21 [Candidatus Magasanikbacteria bacterium GW2011_GWA2_56_11]